MKLKEFIKSFNFNKPNPEKSRLNGDNGASWSDLPEGFPECDLGELSPEEVAKFNAIKTLWELSRPERPKSRSRVWESTNGYIYLVSWSNASLLMILATKWFRWFKEGHYRKLEEVRGKPFEFGYPPVDNLRTQGFTYEIFIELINKTDWHLRRLVESLEKKLQQEQKSYQIEKARIKDKLVKHS